jgi:hypothetical protein
MVEHSPTIQARAVKTYDRLVNKILPGNEDEGDDEMTAEEQQAEMLEYLTDKCEKNESITFEDPQIKSFIEAQPEIWEGFVDSLAAASVVLIIHQVGKLSPRTAEVLTMPHASEWVRLNLKVPAIALRKDDVG